MSTNNKKDNTEVLSYKIDTVDFDRGMNKMIAALEKLERREYLTKLQTSVNGIATGIDNVNFGAMEQGISSVEDRFSTMGIIGMSVINNITNGLLDMAQRFVFDKILVDAANGFAELNIQIGATQTILSNTGDRFGTVLSEVNTGLDALNDYADKTIYNFSNMTQAVGAFTAAGVDLGNSIQAIKGIANMSAYAGAGAEAATSGMYQFSNALSMGYMMLYQWNSLVYSGLGTKQLEGELIASARGLGVDIDAILKEYGGMFRYSLEAGWVDSKVIMHTLAKFSGDVTEEQLRKMKYTEEEIKRIITLGKTAQDSATKVISYEKLIVSLTESVGSGWARTFRLLIGDFEQGKALFTMISDNLLKVIERGAANRNRLVEDWATYGGRDVVVATIDKLLKTYSRLMLVVGQALNQVFPPITGRQIAEATKFMGKLIDKLIPTYKGFDNIGRLIRGFASALDIPIQFFKALGRYLWLIIKPLLKFKFAWIDSMVGFADFMTRLRTEIIKGDLFFKRIVGWGETVKKFAGTVQAFFEDLKKTKAGKVMRELMEAIMMKTGIKDLASVKKFLSDMQASFLSFFNSFDKAKAIETISKFIQAIIGFGKRVYRFLEPAILYVIKLVTNFAKAFGNALEDLATNFTWDKLKDVLGLLMKFVSLKTVIEVIKNFGFASEIFMTLGMGFAKTIGYIGVAIQQFASSNDADTLLAVAIAIGILSASVFMLASLPKEAMERGIAGVTAIYTGLAGSLLALNTILNSTDTLANFASTSLKLALLPPVLIAIAFSVAIMADALLKFKDVPTKQIVKGFGAILGILGAMSMFMLVNSKTGFMSLSSGLGFLGLAVSLTVLAKAIKLFADIKAEEIGMTALALGSMVAILVIMTKSKVFAPDLLILGIGLTGVAASITLLGLAFKYLGSIDWNTMSLGLVNLLAMLGGLYAGMMVFRKVMLVDIAKIYLLAGATAAIGLAFGLIAKLPGLDVLKGSGAMAAGILILYGAVALISPNIIQSIAGLALLSVGIAAFALALSVFKTVDFVAVGLGGLALGIITLALIGLAAVITPILVPVAALAGVLVLIGGTFALFGAGVFLFAASVDLLGDAMVKFTNAGAKFYETAIATMPKAGIALAMFFTMLTETAIKVLPQIATIGTTIIIALCTALIAASPYIANAIIAVANGVLDLVDDITPRVYSTLGKLLMQVLKSLDKNIGTYVVLWNRIQIKFINGLTETIGPMVESLYNYFTALIKALADTIEKDGPELRLELWRLAGVILKFFVEGMVESADMLDTGMKWLTTYILAAGGKEALARMKDFGKIGLYVLLGIAAGLTSPVGLTALSGALGTVVGIMLNKLKEGLDEHSPSRKSFQIADYYMQGLVNALDPSRIKTKMVAIKDAMLSFMDGSLETDLNFQPTISPVLDTGAMAAIERTIASAFGGQPLAFATGGYSLRQDPRLQQNQIAAHESLVFQQSISSPAPLSVEEIARRTTSIMAQSRR